ncbi:hypothetical protein ACFL3F_03090 [Planctomycetota bacterium]
MNDTVHLKLLDKVFTCTVCGCDSFECETLEVSSGGLLAKVRHRPTVMICNQCGYMHWFLPRRTTLQEEDTKD